MTGPRPWLWRHIRSGHEVTQPKEYAAIERHLARQCTSHGVSIRWPGQFPRRVGTGLLLVSAREEPGSEPDPHWIGLIPDVGGLWIADPLRSRMYRSERSATTWWESSGFEDTRSWVAIHAPGHSTASRNDARGVKIRSPREHR